MVAISWNECRMAKLESEGTVESSMINLANQPILELANTRLN